MNKFFLSLASFALCLTIACNDAPPPPPDDDEEEAPTGDNVLTDEEKNDGWKLLFDGNSLQGWRMYQNKSNQTWSAKDGTLYCTGNEEDKSDMRGDLVTDKQYENFELNIDWKIAPKGNSGLMYMVAETGEAPYLTGPEYQMIDDEGFPQKLEGWQKSGANYAMNPPAKLTAKPVGEWNNTRIIVNQGKVEHWLNGEKVVDYELWSDEWNKNKAEGKWKDTPEYGTHKKGHIALQDHGSEIWFKNIKIKEL